MTNNGKRIKNRKLRSKIYISSEGAITEKEYLKNLKNIYQLDNYSINIIGQNKNKSDPLNILRNHKNKVIKAGPNTNFYDGDIEVIIVDMEENNIRGKNIFQPLLDWRNEDIEHKYLIINSTCFEYWLLCHFVDNPKCRTTREINESLKKYWPNYKKSLIKRFNKKEVIKASNRAKKLPGTNEMLESHVCGSNMHELIDLIEKLEKNES